MTTPQISVFLENKAGQLADITGILSQNQVNMRAINIAETTDYGVLRLIVDDAAKASSILLEQGFILTMTPVVGVAVPDTPTTGVMVRIKPFSRRIEDAFAASSTISRNTP